MPIIVITNNGTTEYVGVRELDDSGIEAQLHSGHVVSRGVDRGDVENALQVDYLERLEQHARDCALLEHLVENPPDENSASMLRTLTLLAAKVASEAMDLRTYDPFVVLVANADYSEHVGNGDYAPFVTENHRWPLDVCDPERTWATSELDLRFRAPHRIRYEAERRAEEERKEKERADSVTPAMRRAIEALTAATDKARKADERQARRASKTKRAA